MNNDKKLPCIGYLAIDVDKYLKWLDSTDFITWGENKWHDVFYPLQEDIPEVHKFFSLLWEKPSVVLYTEMTKEEIEKEKLENFKRHTQTYLNSILERLNYVKEFNQRIPVIYHHDVFDLIKLGNGRYIIPTDANCTVFTPLKDYSSVTTNDMRNIKKLVTGENNSGLGELAVRDTSRVELLSKQSSINNTISDIEEEIQRIKNGKTKELEDLQKEVEEKMAELKRQKESLMAIMQEKMEQMQLAKQQMENQIFLLDTEIYSIRCMLGEVVDFVKLCSGNNAGIETPLVFIQKLRYLDEEMGKIASFYDIEWHEIHYFEKLIKSRRDVMETFLPAQKCVCCVRLSKNGLRYNTLHEEYGNILQKYEVTHGGMIGILVRNGDNVYIAWTDDNRISVQENILYVPGSDNLENEQDRDININKYEKESKEKIASRYFIFSIISSLFVECDGRPPILSLPEGASIIQPSKYVIYSTMDNSIEDNRFGQLKDIVKLVNDNIKLGDHIITVQSVRPEGKYERYNNERGIGEKNRTYDVSAKDCTIYPINKVTWEDTKIGYTHKANDRDKETWKREHKKETPIPECPEILNNSFRISDNLNIEQSIKEFKDKCSRNGWHGEIIKMWVEVEHRNYYVSLPKTNYDYIYRNGQYYNRIRDAYANFKLYDDEYINIELLTTLEVQYLITTRKVEGQYIGGQKIDYAYFIPYLNKIMSWVKEREKKEFELINQHINLNSITDWQLKLQNWKIETGHHIIGPKYARMFAKTLI